MKHKKTLRYTQCFKVIEKELTWDLFIKGLNENMEYFFYYNNLIIDIAFHYEEGKKIFELNIQDGENHTYFVFDTVDDLLHYQAFNNKSIFDIWDDLEN